MPAKALRAVAIALCSVFLVLMLPFTRVQAQETSGMAENISGAELVREETRQFYKKGLFDNVTTYSYVLKPEDAFSLVSEKGIASVYFLFDEVPGEFLITDNETGVMKTFGRGFLHECVDLESAFGRAPKSIRLSFPEKGVRLNEIYAFTSGELPGFVQQWEEPVEGETDLVLFSTHGDDEQLFFAGLLPYYAGEREYRVQVVYLTDHNNNSRKRIHEMLDGLWTVGVRAYPVFGTFPDIYSGSLEEALQNYRDVGIREEELLRFVVEQLRRFRPKVAVGHDLAGEYGHGMHKLYADLLCKAVKISADPARYPELAEKYGLWDVPKTYLHLYKENPIRMNWDVPLETFDGKTAYEVTRDLGFPCHKTQVRAYIWYFRGSPTADSVDEYSPCDFGLYRSTVGPDLEKNDFFENLTTYAVDNQMEAELIAAEQARQKALEEERARAQAAEEAARKEEQSRQEQARLQKARQAEEARRQAETRQQSRRRMGMAVLVLMSAGVLGGAWIFTKQRQKGRK